MKLTDEQIAQVRRLRAYRPFLIAYGAVHPETKEFRMGAFPMNYVDWQDWAVAAKCVEGASEQPE